MVDIIKELQKASSPEEEGSLLTKYEVFLYFKC
jgi:hypothetical protein